MQAVAHLVEQLTTQLFSETQASRLCFDLPSVIDPSIITPPATPRWSESPLCASGDDLDEDEAYFLDEEDEDDDDDEDEYDDDDDDDLDDDDEDVDTKENMDEDNF